MSRIFLFPSLSGWLLFLFSCPVSAQSFILLDNFDRANTHIVANANVPWTESESASNDNSKIQILNNNLHIQGCNSDNSAGTSSSEHISLDVSDRYATVFSHAADVLTWCFNMHNSQSDPSGFGSQQYGIAYVLGCDEANFSSSTADGYAVVIGNTGSPDPVRLVAFQNGLSVNSNLTDIINSQTTAATAHYSIRVSFNPCTGNWTLEVRDDNGSFQDPALSTPTFTFMPDAAIHTSLTQLNLKYTGALWQHNTACETALFDNFYIPTAINAVYTWIGSTSTDFQTGTNWQPTRQCPKPNDILQWNHTSPIQATVTNVPTQSIGQLLITDGRAVTFRTPNAGGIKTLSITGANGTDFRLDTASSLTIDADTGLVVNLLTSTTAAIDGQLTFINTATGSSRSHRLLATDAGSIVFRSGSVFTAADLSGNAFGNRGQANTVIFQTGSIYVSQDGAAPFGLAQPASKVVFQPGSLYKHQQNTGLQLVGRTYADVEINTPSIINNPFGGNGSCTIDNLNFIQGRLNFQLSGNNQPLHVTVKGNLTIHNGAVLNFSPTNDRAKSSFIFEGAMPQTISGDGTLNFGSYSDIIFDNTNGVTLSRNLTTSGTVQLKNGRIHTGDYELSVSNNTVAAITAVNGYVHGVLRRSIAPDQPYDFFVGNESHLQRATVRFTEPDCVTSLAVRFRNANPDTSPVTDFTENGVYFSHLLPDGYWELTTNCGNAPASTYELGLYPNHFTGYANLAGKFTITKRIGTGHWHQNGNLHNPDNQATFIQNDQSIRRTNMTGFSNFAVITSVHPLPVHWIYFAANHRNGQTQLEWSTKNEKNNYGFEVQKSRDGKLFENIGFVKPLPGYQRIYNYSFTDLSDECGYYRIRQIDLDGKTNDSKIVSANCPKALAPILYPNPVLSELTIVFPLSAPVLIRLLDHTGRLVELISGSPVQANQKMNTCVSKLLPGMYLLEIRQESQLSTLKMIKR